MTRVDDATPVPAPVHVPPPAQRPSSREPVVEVRGLRVAYGSHEVVRGIDLTIERGEVFTLLGPNGAGKTTTIEVLEGLRHRSAGEVAVLGVDPVAERDRGERVGIVLQSWRDHGRWRVGDLLAHSSRYYRRPRDPHELLELTGLVDSTRQPCSRLSGGQRRRLDVALGLLGRPELLFLDEPTTGFDPVAREELHLLLERLRREEGLTIVLTTHDLAESERLSDRVGILVRGELVACGSIAQLAAQIAARAEVTWTEDGRHRREQAADPSELVWQLSRHFAGPVPDLAVRRPSLQETYLGFVRGEPAERTPTAAPGTSAVVA